MSEQLTPKAQFQAQCDVSTWLVLKGFNFTTNRHPDDVSVRIWNLPIGMPSDANRTMLTLQVIGEIFAVSSQLALGDPDASYSDVLLWLVQTIPYVKIVSDDSSHVSIRAEFPIHGPGPFSVAYETIEAATSAVYNAVATLIDRYPSRFKRTEPDYVKLLGLTTGPQSVAPEPRSAAAPSQAALTDTDVKSDESGPGAR